MTMVYVQADGTVQECLQPENHEQMLWAMWSDPTSLKLPQVRCPALIVTAESRRQGRSEEFLRRRREQVDAAQAALLNGRVVWIPDSGHDIGYEKPKELADTLEEFLTTATSRAG